MNGRTFSQNPRKRGKGHQTPISKQDLGFCFRNTSTVEATKKEEKMDSQRRHKQWSRDETSIDLSRQMCSITLHVWVFDAQYLRHKRPPVTRRNVATTILSNHERQVSFRLSPRHIDQTKPAVKGAGHGHECYRQLRVSNSKSVIHDVWPSIRLFSFKGVRRHCQNLLNSNKRGDDDDDHDDCCQVMRTIITAQHKTTKLLLNVYLVQF